MTPTARIPGSFSNHLMIRIQGAEAHSATDRNTGKNPVFWVCCWHYQCLYTGPMAKYPIIRTKQFILKLLAKEHKCHDQDSNPHSVDQKHKSLTQVVLTAQPWQALEKISCGVAAVNKNDNIQTNRCRGFNFPPCSVFRITKYGNITSCDTCAQQAKVVNS